MKKRIDGPMFCFFLSLCSSCLHRITSLNGLRKLFIFKSFFVLLHAVFPEGEAHSYFLQEPQTHSVLFKIRSSLHIALGSLAISGLTINVIGCIDLGIPFSSSILILVSVNRMFFLHHRLLERDHRLTNSHKSISSMRPWGVMFRF